MGFRFRKSFKVMPGVRINMSKSGFSTTIGGRGASVNISKRGTYVNTSIPGTGIGSRTKISGKSRSQANTYAAPAVPKTPQPASTRWLSFGATVFVLAAAGNLLTFIESIGTASGANYNSLGAAAMAIVLAVIWLFVRRSLRASKQARYERYQQQQADEQAKLAATIAEEKQRSLAEQEQRRLAAYEPALTKARALLAEGVFTPELLAQWEKNAQDGSFSASLMSYWVDNTESTRRFEIAEATRLKACRERILSKYDEETATLLLNRNIQIGMSREQVLDSLGDPTKTERTLVKEKEREVLIYGSKTAGSYFHIVDGFVTKAVVR